jgi:hypothetical protein
MDRRLKGHKRSVKRRLYGTTRPGSLLQQMIPIKTDPWDVTVPGYLEIDLVSHSGASAAGEFIYTLDCVDIATGWVERRAVMGKGQVGIVNALREIEQKLPFPLGGTSVRSLLGQILYPKAGNFRVPFCPTSRLTLIGGGRTKVYRAIRLGDRWCFSLFDRPSSIFDLDTLATKICLTEKDLFRKIGRSRERRWSSNGR